VVKEWIIHHNGNKVYFCIVDWLIIKLQRFIEGRKSTKKNKTYNLGYLRKISYVLERFVQGMKIYSLIY